MKKQQLLKQMENEWPVYIQKISIEDNTWHEVSVRRQNPDQAHKTKPQLTRHP